MTHVAIVLTWIHIYLFSHTQSSSSAATSLRIYYEVNQANDYTNSQVGKYYNSKVPLGISIFPGEVVVAPLVWHRRLGRVIHSSKHASGGHFAAYERPVELVKDIKAMCKLPEVHSRLC